MNVILLAGNTVLADNDTGKGSPIGIFVVLLLVIAVYFLYRSLSRHIRNLPESFDEPAAPAPEETPAEQSAAPTGQPAEPEQE